MGKPSSGCTSVQTTLKVLGGKWKPPILFMLSAKTMRFGELKKAISGITQKMLTQELREMENDGLVNRKVFAEIPPKVEYSLTAYGKSLEPILKSMSQWGEKHKNRV
ncbi:MAG: helix-turn-helix domain-containing protein [Candidatus Doudnabacteria bacterium]|nr:helix-turn-helix domain-containing protein [Candidatus Doudnabacteria bacterium]